MSKGYIRKSDELFFDFLESLWDLCRVVAPRRQAYDFLKIILVLYSWKCGDHLSISPDGKLNGINPNADPLLRKLWDIAVQSLGDNDFLFFKGLFRQYSRLGEKAYKERYPRIINDLLARSPEQFFHGTNALPPFPISRTIAEYLRRHGCHSVLNTNAGISSLALALPNDIEYRHEEPSMLYSLIGDVVLDAAGIPNIMESPTAPDALVSILPVNYSFDKVFSWSRDCSEKGKIQADFFDNAQKERPARKVIIGLIHYEVANDRSYNQRLDRDRFIHLRQKLAESGFLDMVMTFPDDTFSDAKALTSLVFLDLEKKDNLVTFITPESGLDLSRISSFTLKDPDIDLYESARADERSIVPISELNNTNWCLNAYLYVQPEVYQKPYKLVRLGDIAEITLDDFALKPKDGHVIRPESFSSSVYAAIRQVPLGDPMYDYSCFKKITGPAVFFHFNMAGILSACVNYSDNECYTEDDCIAIRPKDNRVSLDYLAYLILTEERLQKTLRNLSEYYCQGNIRPYHFNYIKVPILDDPKLQEDELKMYRSGMPERFREEFPEFFTAAGWVDGRFGMRIGETISEYFRNNCSFPESSANRPFNTIRSLTHDLIRQMKELELVPPIDEGAVPTFLSDGKYKNRDGAIYELTRPFMDEDVVSALEYVCSIGSEGSHKIQIDGTNLRREILKGFMKFTRWIYGHKELFEKKGIGYFTEKTPYETSSKAGKKQITGTVRRVSIDGNEYLCCENVHLFVDRRNPKVREGDTVIIRDYVEEGKPELREAGITLFAKNAKCYRKVNG